MVTSSSTSDDGTVVTASGVDSTARLEDFTISDGNGGGMYNYQSSSPTVTNCTFSGNSAFYGGGMFNSSSSPVVTNCAFSGNSASKGGGMYNVGLSNFLCSPTVTNCILWDNTPYEIYNDSHSSTQITYCDVQGGYDGTGNINGLPMLTPDFHLLIGSPCIDTGDNNAPSLPAKDFDGNSRILDGDGNGTATVDMGADEYLNT